MRDSSNSAKAREPDRSMVLIVDDDADLRDALSNLFLSVGMQVAVYGSAPELLQSRLPEVPSCLVLDIRLPEVSGLDFQVQLDRLGIHLPIVFMTGHGDIPMSVRAMKAGAIDFLAKPFRDQDMLDAVAAAIDRDRERRATLQMASAQRERYATLTPREAEVMKYVTSGLLNKQIAGMMDLAEITVKVHRGNMIRKMQAKSVADLVRMADNLGIRKD